jgi:hypothetical protein
MPGPINTPSDFWRRYLCAGLRSLPRRQLLSRVTIGVTESDVVLCDDTRATAPNC